MKKVLCSILCAAMLLTLLPTALAAGTSGGLAAFTDQKQYADGIFTDVASGAWYAGSIATVYTKGIMDGMDGGRFDPDRTIPWSQAVTIAARLHAAYRGKDIPAAADGLWYVPYLDYARDNGLLPAICPADEDTNTTPITREGMAVLFRSVLDEQDLPAINDQTIPDLNDVRAEYRDAVSEMFTSGIFTGIDGKFVPDGQATRAQVATIITRLLCPGQRVSHDARQNPYMLDQMGNLYNGGLCTRLGDTVYYLFKTPHLDSEGKSDPNWDIVARTDDGKIRRVYTSTGVGLRDLSDLSASPDGQLCFIQRDQPNKRDILKQLDLKTGAVKDLYASPSSESIGFYLFYDGDLYVHQKFGRTDLIGRVDNGKMTTLATIPNDREHLYVDDTMYCFGGKLYWLQLAPRNSKGDDHLMILDLETGKTESVVTEADEFAYQGATAWSTEFTNGNLPKVLKRRSLLMPELTETMRVLDSEFALLYDNLYANGSQLYYQVSGAKKLWALSPSGEAEEIATARTPYYQASAVTSQGTILMINDLLSAYDPQSIEVLLPAGEKTNLSAFLNQPHWLEGVDQLEPAADSQVKASWGNSDADRDDVYSEPLKAFLTADGSLALEVQITNTTPQKLDLTYVQVTLSNTVEGEVYFSFFQSPESIRQEPEQYTFVFPKDSAEIKGDLEGLDLNIAIFGNLED